MEYFIITGCVIVLTVLIYGYIQNFFLKVEQYEIRSARIDRDVTVVLLTDLHGC